MDPGGVFNKLPRGISVNVRPPSGKLTGLIYYVYLVAIMSPWAWNSTWKWMPKLRLASVIAGVGMVLYLVYAELFQIDAICPYCTSVHIITFVLFVLITLAAALWGLAPGRPQQQS